MTADSPSLVSGKGLQLVLLVVTLFSAYLVLGRVGEYWRLRHFKGPATTGISWLWHSRAIISGRAHEYYGEVTEKYGEFTEPSDGNISLDSAKDLLRELRRPISSPATLSSGPR
jgi:hypothetical protein